MFHRLLCFLGLHTWSTPVYNERVLDRKGRTFWRERYDPEQCTICGLHK